MTIKETKENFDLMIANISDKNDEKLILYLGKSDFKEKEYKGYEVKHIFIEEQKKPLLFNKKSKYHK